MSIIPLKLWKKRQSYLKSRLQICWTNIIYFSTTGKAGRSASCGKSVKCQSTNTPDSSGYTAQTCGDGKTTKCGLQSNPGNYYGIRDNKMRMTDQPPSSFSMYHFTASSRAIFCSNGQDNDLTFCVIACAWTMATLLESSRCISLSVGKCTIILNGITPFSVSLLYRKYMIAGLSIFLYDFSRVIPSCRYGPGINAVLSKPVPAPAYHSAAYCSPWRANAHFPGKAYPVWPVMQFSRYKGVCFMS